MLLRILGTAAVTATLGAAALFLAVEASSGTFDGTPPAPLPHTQSAFMDGWDRQIHERSMAFSGTGTPLGDAIHPLNAQHGPDCAGPPATHNTGPSRGAAVFQCNNHVMTALNGDEYGVIYLMRDQMADFTAGPAVIEWEMSTEKLSVRDWPDITISPLMDAQSLPLLSDLSNGVDLQGPNRNSIVITTDNAEGSPNLKVVRNGNVTAHGGSTPLNAGIPGTVNQAATRQPMRITLSQTSVRFERLASATAPAVVYFDTPVAALGWAQGVVQFGHHSYDPGKCGARLDGLDAIRAMAQAVALSTKPHLPTPEVVGVGVAKLGVGVPFGAVRHFTGTVLIGSPNILSLSDGFKVGGVNAYPASTQVIQLETIGDSPLEGFVYNAVGDGIPHSPVPIAAFTANPVPAPFHPSREVDALKDRGGSHGPSVAPQQACTNRPQTWHWDSFSITPSVPFYLDYRGGYLSAAGTVTTEPAPANAYLRFAAVCRVSVDGVFASKMVYSGNPLNASSYLVPVAAGSTQHTIAFANDEWYETGFGCNAKDFSVVSETGGAPSPSPSTSPTGTSTPTPTASPFPSPTETSSPTPTPSASPSPSPTPSPDLRRYRCQVRQGFSWVTVWDGTFAGRSCP